MHYNQNTTKYREKSWIEREGLNLTLQYCKLP